MSAAATRNTNPTQSALHEAGHALIALLEGREDVSASIGVQPVASFSPPVDDGPEAVRSDLRIVVAGIVAEQVIKPGRGPAFLDDDVYLTDVEIAFEVALRERAKARGDELDENGAVVVVEHDHAAAARLAGIVNPDDVDGEVGLAVELVERTLTVHEDVLRRIAEHLDQWRVATYPDLLRIRGGGDDNEPREHDAARGPLP